MVLLDILVVGIFCLFSESHYSKFCLVGQLMSSYENTRLVLKSLLYLSRIHHCLMAHINYS